MEDETRNPRRSPDAALKRRLHEEAGYRCAIPTCRSTSVLEMAHIKPWAEVQANEFENMIVLCALCHGLYDREKKIPEASIRVFKANLGLLVGRYSQMEIRLLEQFSKEPDEKFLVTGLDQMMFRGLIDDGHLIPGIGSTSIDLPVDGRMFKMPLQWVYELTSSGRKLATDLMEGRLLS